MKRVFLIVLDSCGIGQMPDCEKFGDIGVNTLRSCSTSRKFSIPNLLKAGIGSIDGVDYLPKAEQPQGAYARLTEASMGKDTTIGHWEIAGVVSPEPLPTFPEGFPEEVLAEFEKQTGRGVLCNKPYSGTDVIRDYGEEQLKTGKWIVYTSADSVFQVAAHENLIPLEELYDACRKARKLLRGKYGVGRVIARPYVGKKKGEFVRTSNRHDYALKPTGTTALNILKDHGYDVISVGKIRDIFDGEGITESHKSKSSVHGMEQTIELCKKDFSGLCFVNLVDFDALWGHRRDPIGYGKELERFDEKLGELLPLLGEDDLLMITADHGNDPTYTGTDHTREKVPFLAYSPSMKGQGELPEAETFAVIGGTILDNFGLKKEENMIGDSVLEKLV